MKSPQAYVDEVNQTFGGGVNFHWDNVWEAKLNLKKAKLVQQQLRKVKKEIGLDIATLRDQKRLERAQIGQGVMTELARGLFGRGLVGRTNSARRHDAKMSMEAELAPYKSLKEQIEQLLLQLDQIKIELEAYIAING